jgi:RNA ligase
MQEKTIDETDENTNANTVSMSGGLGGVASLSSWHSYPKIFALGHRAIAELFLDDVLIEEKVDGSQFSFGRFGGELKCRSKGATLNVEYPEKMFAEAVETAKSLDLIDGWTYRGEYLKKPKHNALAYDRVPNKHIILFDINTAEEEYLTYDDKRKEAERIGLEIVPIIHSGRVSDPSTLLAFLERESILGGQKIEGVVAKNYHRFGMDKKALMGKYVAEAYKEVHSAEWKESNPTTGDVIQRLILQLRTPARWNKAVQHLRENGELTETPKDIGNLIKEAQRDIEEECSDEIKESLYRYAISHIKRGVTGGLPEWYKEQLLQLQFTKQDATST